MTWRISGNAGNGATAVVSLNVQDGSYIYTLENPTNVASTPSNRLATQVELALSKEGDYYTGYYRAYYPATDTGWGTVLGWTGWIKLGTVKASLITAKSGIHATKGFQDVSGWTISTWEARFSNFTIRQKPVDINIDPATKAYVKIAPGSDVPKYAWAVTMFSDGSKGSVLVKLPTVTIIPGVNDYSVKGTVAGETKQVDVIISTQLHPEIMSVLPDITNNKVTVNLNSSEPDNAVLIVAVYGGGKLLSHTRKMTSQNGNVVVDINIPATADNIKAMMWDADTFIPLCPLKMVHKDGDAWISQ
jgi:hypothetical protein